MGGLLIISLTKIEQEQGKSKGKFYPLYDRDCLRFYVES